MRIAINTRFLLPSKMEGFGWYTLEITKRLIDQYPEHTFVLFYDRAPQTNFFSAHNVEEVVLSPKARHPILFIYWFEVAVKKALVTYNIDVFFSPDGYLSLRSTIPQIGTIHDINFEHYPEDIPPIPRWYLRYFFPKFAHKATHIFTVSAYSKQDICRTYTIPEEKISVCWNGSSDAYMPLSDKNQEKIRNEYTNGKPYILFVGSLHPRKNLKRLIQAFNQFKKKYPEREEKLLVVGTKLFRGKGYGLTEELLSDKNIYFTGHLQLDVLTQIMGAATLFAFVPYFEGFGIPLVEAMKCKTPILCGNKTSLPEVVGEAGVLVDPMDTNAIAYGLEQILLNPDLQKDLAEKGFERSKIFSWDNAAIEIGRKILEIGNTKRNTVKS